MKSKLILMGVVVIVLLSLVACSSQTSPSVQHAVSCDAFMKDQHIREELEISVDDSLTVVLCSNWSTGFQRSELSQISDQSVLEQTSHMYVSAIAEDGKSPAPGTSGKEVWTFKTLKKGTTEMSMENSRPWEGDEKAEGHLI